MTLGWQLDPVLIGGILSLAVGYGLLVGPLRARIVPNAPFPKRKVAFFYAALVILYLAEGSPLHDLAEIYLFSAHMVQHLALSYVVAPLLIRGMPDWLLRPLLLNRWTAPLARGLTQPLVALLVFSFFFSVWHVPAIYEAALRNNLVHHLEHVLFIGTALMVWWPIMSPLPELPRLSYAGQIIYLFLLPVGQFLVAALLTFSSETFYATYAAAPRMSGLTAVADQQLGGIIMKAAGFIAFGIPFVVAFFRWYRQENPPRRRRSATPGGQKSALD